MNWRDLPPEQQTPEWVRGWMVARFKHHDMRLWAEQESGYRELDRLHAEDENSAGAGPSGYDWSAEMEAHGLMPPKDRQRYIAEADTLPTTNIAALMAGQVDVRKPIPALADDDPIPF